MADTKLTGLTATTSVVDADLVYVVTNVATTAASKKVTRANLLKGHYAKVSGTSGNFVGFNDAGDVVVDSGSKSADFAIAGHNHNTTYIPQISGTSGNVVLLDAAGAAISDSGYAIGTSANNLVKLTSEAKLPAVNGSLLTSIPYIPQISGTSGHLVLVDAAGAAIADSGVAYTTVPIITTSTGVPSSTPGKKGDINVANTGNIYIAKGTTGAGSWICLTNAITQ